jgi:hypothetical protein
MKRARRHCQSGSDLRRMPRMRRIRQRRSTARCQRAWWSEGGREFVAVVDAAEWNMAAREKLLTR